MTRDRIGAVDQRTWEHNVGMQQVPNSAFKRRSHILCDQRLVIDNEDGPSEKKSPAV